MRKTVFLLSTTFALNAHATILPENSLEIPVNSKNEGLTEAEYSSIIDVFEKVYRPEVEKLGKKLTVNRLWANPRVNAGTLRKENEWIFNLYGGYARHPLITRDGYALVLCHEIGHHLGGPPKKTFQSGKGWPSVEGQSDYYATSECLKRIFREDSSDTSRPDPVVESICSEIEDQFCRRILSAGLAAGSISAQIRSKEVPDYRTPDPKVVSKVFEAHPEPQCRLDTYLAGAIQKDRPLCWYSPK